VPLFRPQNFIAPQELEDLQPIQLRTVLYDPRANISKEILDRLMPDRPPLADPKEVNTPAWQMEWEPESHFRGRILKDFKSWLNRHVADRRRSAQSAGLVKAPGKRELSHFAWAAKYQITGESAAAIAEEHGSHVTKHAVEKAVQGILHRIRLEPRDPRPGPRPARSLTTSINRSQTLREFVLRVLAGGGRNS
jgi:hypothetical protein